MDEPGSLKLAPPKKGLCPECATKHEPQAPHNLVSLYFQVQFKLAHGRTPTWEDAWAHCEPAVQAAWRQVIQEIEREELDHGSEEEDGNGSGD